MAFHFWEFNGKIGKVVFYKRGGKDLVRKAPRKGNRTAAMKTRSRNFGLASGATKTLRTLLYKFIPNPTNKSMQSRFTGAVAQWIGGRGIKDIKPETNIGPLIT